MFLKDRSFLYFVFFFSRVTSALGSCCVDSVAGVVCAENSCSASKQHTLIPCVAAPHSPPVRSAYYGATAVSLRGHQHHQGWEFHTGRLIESFLGKVTENSQYEAARSWSRNRAACLQRLFFTSCRVFMDGWRPDSRTRRTAVARVCTNRTMRAWSCYRVGF